MCGIFAAINGQSVTNSLLTGLETLSYRGYDSAGIAVIGQRGLERRRAKGKLKNLSQVLQKAPLEGSIGIAHTRWATHGTPDKHNAHPHMTSKVAVVHNGIIENYQSLRDSLSIDGYCFCSDTDSETIPVLIDRELDKGLDHYQALKAALSALDGSFAIVAIFHDRPDMLFAARQGSPLVVGQAQDGFYLASDSNALGAACHAICHLEDGDIACISRDGLIITELSNQTIKLVISNQDKPKGTSALHPFNPDYQQCDKDGYRHFMLKEIHEQPDIFAHTSAHYLNKENSCTQLPELPFAVDKLQRLSIIACGTSHYAGMIGKYWLENLAALPVDLDIASEYRYRNLALAPDQAALFISQSGETADTLAALRHTMTSGTRCLSIVNATNSSMAYESNQFLPILAGPEIGVASTKAFIAQLTVLLMLTLAAARARSEIKAYEETHWLQSIHQLPDLMRPMLDDQHVIQDIAGTLQNASNMLFLGRGIAYPLALEGALKLKEISYIHAEAYPAGELKHGPIALIDENMPVIMIAPPGPLFSKSLSNLREVTSRGAKVVLISDQAGIDEAMDHIDHAIVMPEVTPLLQPILYTLPLQLLAYHIAVLKGTDIDQPRNLAKSVTVE